MLFYKPKAELFIPDHSKESDALKRATHMSIAAHQDDIEIMAYDGIIKCYDKQDKWFSGVVVTNGSGSAREGLYKNFTDEEMMNVRREEQKKASVIGKFGSLVLLDYSSKETKNPSQDILVKELAEILRMTKPEVLYTHNLADKHDTHIAVATKTIQAVRLLPKEDRPKQFYGCEVWRGLDWMMDSDKILFDVSQNPELAAELLSVFESQIIGGKRYDLATLGRRLANATYTSSHTVDQAKAIIYAMDLLPLIEDDSLDISDYIESFITRFKNDVIDKLRKNIK